MSEAQPKCSVFTCGDAPIVRYTYNSMAISYCKAHDEAYLKLIKGELQTNDWRREVLGGSTGIEIEL